MRGVISPFIKPTKVAGGNKAELVRYRLSDSTTEIKRDFIKRGKAALARWVLTFGYGSFGLRP